MMRKVPLPLFHRLGSREWSDLPQFPHNQDSIAGSLILEPLLLTCSVVMKSRGDNEYKKGSSNAGQRTREAACPDTIQGNCTPGVLWVSLRRGGEERNCINICFCLNAHVPAPLHQLGEPSWRMKNAALASEKKTPGHALMRGGGVTADRKIKLSAGALRPQPGLNLLTEQQETPAVGLPQLRSCFLLHLGRPRSPPVTGLIWDN